RRRVGAPLTRAAVAAAGYALALVLLLPHLVMALISLVPAGTWIAEPFPPVLNLRNYAQLADREHLRPIVNSLWMAATATAAAAARLPGPQPAADRPRGARRPARHGSGARRGGGGARGRAPADPAPRDPAAAAPGARRRRRAGIHHRPRGLRNFHRPLYV